MSDPEKSNKWEQTAEPPTPHPPPPPDSLEPRHLPVPSETPRYPTQPPPHPHPSAHAYPYQHPYGAGPPVAVVSQKSAGIAVLLTFFWLGAGNLYANQIGAGVTLLIVNFPLVMLAATLIGAIIAVPLWFVLFIVAATTATTGVGQHNAKYGLI